MANILKNTSGQIWENTEGKIFTSTPMNQNVIQDGLAFWGRADSNFLTIVDGLVSEAYDVRGTGVKMTQSTVINRPAYTPNSLYITLANQKLTRASNSALSMFLVFKGNGTGGVGLGYDFYNGIFSSGVSPVLCSYKKSNTYQTFFDNDVKYVNTTGPRPTSGVVLHTLTSFLSNTSLSVGDLAGNAGNAYSIYEWGWYNRVLNELEVVYNTNALNARYSIF